MKKVLLSLVLAVAILVLAAYVVGQFFLGAAVKAGVNTVGPRLTKSKVALADASLSPFTGTGSVTGLTVGNPEGWSAADAVSIGQVRFDVQPRSIFGDTIVINDLTVDRPEFVYETHLISSNIGDLVKNIEAAAGGGDEPAPKSGKPRKFVVKHFRMSQGRVTVGMGPAAVPLTLSAIELKDLGVAEGGLTSGQLAFAVFRQILPSIIEATTKGAGTLGGTLGASAGDAVKRAGENLQKLFEKKK